MLQWFVCKISLHACSRVGLQGPRRLISCDDKVGNFCHSYFG